MLDQLTGNTALILAPRRAALLAGFDNQLDVLIRIQAPDAPGDVTKDRPAYAIALVIDRSGSMAGHPLQEAKRCAAFVVDRLRADDTIAIVQFDNRVKILCSSKLKADGCELKRAIDSIEPGGNTNLHGGWRAGAGSLVDTLSATGLRRVILLSDGCANEGLTDTSAIAEQCKEMAGKGISTSTYGLGRHFNEELMVLMAKAGQGNHYYGDTADDLMEPFQQELDLLSNLAVKDLRLQVEVVAGGTVGILNPFEGNATDGWRLPDLAWGSEAWAMLRLRLPKALVPAEGQELLCLQVRVQGVDLDGNIVALPRQDLKMLALNPALLASVAEDDLVLRRLSELEAAGVLTRMREAAKAHDWGSVDRLLVEAEQRFAGNDWVASVLEAIRIVARSRSRERFMKESMYSSERLFSRLSDKNEILAMAEGHKASYLRRKTSQGKAEFEKD